MIIMTILKAKSNYSNKNYHNKKPCHKKILAKNSKALRHKKKKLNIVILNQLAIDKIQLHLDNLKIK